METKILKIHNIALRYLDEGSGTPVILLHGYLESLEIWHPFAERLSETCRVICPDLPGHGHSGIVTSVHSMDLIAMIIRELLIRLSVDKCVVIGHSMGGYVALAFAENHPEQLKGFSLFHSVPFADTEEKKNIRDREIELVRQGKKELLINTNIPKGFADHNLGRLKSEIERAKKIGLKTPDAGIIALLEGMKCRPDRSMVISKYLKPFLWIVGRKDNYINFEQVQPRMKVGERGQVLVLDNSGHMGFIEEPETSLEAVKKFIDQCK